MKKLIVILSVALGIQLMGCEFDSDCVAGASCIKDGFSIYGVCAGGPMPGNRYDAQPTQGGFEYGPTKTMGNTCSNNFDCNYGQKCHKGSGYEGTCY